VSKYYIKMASVFDGSGLKVSLKGETKSEALADARNRYPRSDIKSAYIRKDA
jgi:hypothetical protein